MKKEYFNKLYYEYAHKIQTAIAFLISSSNFNAHEPKHLRVGIDLLRAEQTALAELLIAKGIFTEEEYMEVIIKGLEKEAERYGDRVRKIAKIGDIQIFR